MIVLNVLNLSSSGKYPSCSIVLVNTKKIRAETDESEDTGNCLEANNIELIDTRPDPKEIGDLTQFMHISNNILGGNRNSQQVTRCLHNYQDKAKMLGTTYMNSVCLNSILDLSDEEIYRDFAQYIEQFTENTCTQAEVLSLVQKFYISGIFDLYHYKSHDIAQQILTHL
ncbi:14774_t:CDS:2, partial [Dentiscutata heterogama]